MKIVAIETSGTTGCVAVGDETGPLDERILAAARKHARDLAPALRDMIDDRGWRADDVDLILVDLGPGSYTGLRVGITTAKTLAYVTGRNVIGIDAMMVLAESAPPDAQSICTVVDALQGMVYASWFVRDAVGSPPRALADIDILPAEDWCKRLDPSTYVTGPGLDRCASLVPSACDVADEESRQPQAAALIAAGLRAHREGRRDDLWTLEPLYLRASSAELNWDRRRAQADEAKRRR